jgi:hypothetical protein
MMAFPGGAWDSESFPDVLAWLPVLKKLPKVSAVTHAIVGVIRLSSAITALSLTGASTDDDDEDDHDHDDKNKVLDAEEQPALTKVAKDKGKGKEEPMPGHEEKASPVRNFRFLLYVFLLTVLFVVRSLYLGQAQVLWPKWQNWLRPTLRGAKTKVLACGKGNQDG